MITSTMHHIDLIPFYCSLGFRLEFRSWVERFARCILIRPGVTVSNGNFAVSKVASLYAVRVMKISTKYGGQLLLSWICAALLRLVSTKYQLLYWYRFYVFLYVTSHFRNMRPRLVCSLLFNFILAQQIKLVLVNFHHQICRSCPMKQPRKSCPLGFPHEAAI